MGFDVVCVVGSTERIEGALQSGEWRHHGAQQSPREFVGRIGACETGDGPAWLQHDRRLTCCAHQTGHPASQGRERRHGNPHRSARAHVAPHDIACSRRKPKTSVCCYSTLPGNWRPNVVDLLSTERWLKRNWFYLLKSMAFVNHIILTDAWKRFFSLGI